MFLRQSAFNPQIPSSTSRSFWWNFLEQRETCHSDPCMVQTVTCLHPCCNMHRWSRLEVHQGVSVSEHRHNSEVSENRSSEHGAPSLEEHDADKCNLPQDFRSLVQLRDLDSDLGITAVPLAIFRPFSFFLNVHLF